MLSGSACNFILQVRPEVAKYPFHSNVPGVESQIEDPTRNTATPSSNPWAYHLTKAFEFGKSLLPMYTHWNRGKEAPAEDVHA